MSIVKTRNEKLLLGVLIAVVFIGGNYFGYDWLAQQQAKLKLDVARLRADNAEAELALEESDMWAQRKAWIAAQEPAMAGDEGTTKAAVLEAVLKGARENKLEVQEQNLGDVEQGAAGTRVNVAVKVKGGMEPLVKWLTSLEKPDQFYAITSFSLKADQDLKSYICDVRIARYFKGGS